MAEEYTLDQLHGIQTDPEQETKVAQALGIPEGTYNSVPELSLTLRTAGEAAAHPGRKSARYYGFFQSPEGQGRAAFEVSWEYRDKVDFQTKETQPGKPDNQSKLWHQACNAYRTANQLPRKAVVQVADVVAFLQKYAVSVRFIYLEGRDEPLAVAISRAKE